MPAPYHKESPSESYDPELYAKHHEAEDRHFWFRSRNRLIAAVAAQLGAAFPPGYRVLEVGCGTGNVLRFLEQACSKGRVYGMDLFHEGLRYARRRTGCATVQGDMHRPPFGVGFNVIGLFDVLEHLPDDLEVLRCLHEMLADDGYLLLTVPAHPFLWSYWDKLAHHCRRYTEADLIAKLVGCGYDTVYSTPFMSLAFFPLWLKRRLTTVRRNPAASARQHGDALLDRELRVVPLINEFLTVLLSMEARCAERRWRIPVGTSLLVVARRKPRADAPVTA